MAHVFTEWMAFESGKTFLLSLKLFQQVVLVQIAKLTLTEYLLGQESQARAVVRSENMGASKHSSHFFSFYSCQNMGGIAPIPLFQRLCLAPTNLRAA